MSVDQYSVRRHQTWREVENAHIKAENDDTFNCPSAEAMRTKYDGLLRAMSDDYERMHYDFELECLRNGEVLVSTRRLCQVNAKRRKTKAERERSRALRDGTAAKEKAEAA